MQVTSRPTAPPTKQTSGRDGVLVALALAACALYHWVGLTHVAGPNYDDVIYLVLGKALATGHGYHVIGQPGAPVETAYPPIYPLLLAAIWAYFPAWPANLWAFKALNIVATLVASLLLYRLASRTYGLARTAAVLAAVLTATSSAVSMMMDLTMSELVYMAAVVGVIAWLEPAFERLKAVSPGSREEIRIALTAGFLVGLVMMTKSIGLTLGGATGLWLLLQRRWTAALLYGVALALTNAPWVDWVWWARHTGVRASADYASWAQANMGPSLLGQTLVDNLSELWHISLPIDLAGVTQSMTLVRFGLAPVLTGLCALVILVAALGLGVTARARLRVYHVYVVSFLLFVAAFPWEPTRYTTTLTPFVVLGYVTGCGAIARRGKAGQVLAAVLVVLALIGVPWRVASLSMHHATHDALLQPEDAQRLQDRLAFAAWAPTHLPPHSLIVHPRDPLVYLDTGFEAEPYNEGLHPTDTTRALFASRPTYLVFFPHLAEYQTTHAVLRSLLGPAHPVFQGPLNTLEVYRLTPAVWERP